MCIPSFLLSCKGVSQVQSCRQLSSRISTRMISSPTWRTHSQGMRYFALPAQKTENLSGPGEDQGFDAAGFTVEGEVHRAARFLQVQQLITSFCFSSHTRMITEPFSFMLCLTEGGECIILKKTLGSTGDILYEMSILQSG